MNNFPISNPKKRLDARPAWAYENPMSIVTGRLVILELHDWVYWQYAWEVVYSDAGTMQ